MGTSTVPAPPSGGADPPERRYPETEAARGRTLEALALLGLLGAGKTHGCPRCNAADPAHSPKTVVFADGGFHCRRCDAVGGPASRPGGSEARPNPNALGNAVDLLVTAGYAFRDAVDLLNGRPAAGREPPDVTDVETIAEFEAVVDYEVYDFVLESGDRDAAVAFYARWHIARAVVHESRATLITNPVGLGAALKSSFGVERLLACGIVTEKGYLLVNPDYPVIEPHLTPAGAAAGLQFRAAEHTERTIAAHKAGTGPYVPKFLSLRGAPRSSRLGFGLARIETLPPGQRLWVVEGFKDMLAARTMGLEAFGLPGAGVRPVPAVAKRLAQHTVVIAFDSDNGGDVGRASLEAYLREFGITVEHRHPPAGKDVTDVLMEKVSHGWTSPER